MNWLWIGPAALVVIGLVPLVVMIRAAAEEASRLGVEVRRLGELRPAVVEIRSRTAEVRDSLQSRAR